MLGPLIELLEVIRRVIEVTVPVVAEPAHVALDRVDVLLLFFGRVGVVEAQVAAAAELLRHAEVERDRLGVANVEIAVRLGWEACDHVGNAPGRHVPRDDVADEIVPDVGNEGFGCCHR